MLEPNSRTIYLEQLRPPIGYQLDRAVATTFSLDLLTLLMAPLSMALNECRSREESLKDPIAVLDALRQTTSKVTVFCQQGRIAVPQKDALLYRYLEPIVVEVRPPGKGVFHPKSWLLRFVSEREGEPVVYRFLCLSRNLTFDRSWDTVLTLEGVLQDRQKAHARNRPLSEFFACLPNLACHGLSDRQRQDVATMADEVLRVKFEPPEEFNDEMFFLPMGIPGHDKLPNNDDARRVLIVSPFLSDETVTWLTEDGSDNILISRPESLDALAEDTVKNLEENTKLFCLDEAAEKPEENREAEADAEDSVTAGAGEDFSGLHAKLFIIENGWYATVYSGSANATDPAMNGNNVELMVATTGMKKRVGIDAFLGDDQGPLSFRSMLRPYTRGSTIKQDKDQRRLEAMLDDARKAIASAGLAISVAPANEGLYDLLVTASSSLALPNGVTAGCFPISLSVADAQVVSPQELPRFSQLSLASVTAFMAFSVSAEVNGRSLSTGFVLNLPVSGMPEHRDKRVLQEIISDPARFIRYLLLILAEEDEILGPEFDPTGGCDAGAWRYLGGVPLLEEMVRAFSRHTDKIARIQQLVDDLKSSPHGAAVLPQGFDELWKAFHDAQAKRQQA